MYIYINMYIYMYTKIEEAVTNCNIDLLMNLML